MKLRYENSMYLPQDYKSSGAGGLLKDRIISLFFSGTDTQVIFHELNELFRKHLIPIRPNRSFERIKDKYRNRQKPKVPKNMKDSL